MLAISIIDINPNGNQPQKKFRCNVQNTKITFAQCPTKLITFWFNLLNYKGFQKVINRRVPKDLFFFQCKRLILSKTNRSEFESSKTIKNKMIDPI